MKSKRRQLALAALAAALLTFGAAGAAARQPSGAGAHASVIGGAAVRIENYPWLAFIESDPGADRFAFSCTGTVIAPRVVLTAGHCVEDLETEAIERPASYLVATGVASRLHVPAEHLSRVRRALLFPGFRPTYVHGDAGLLILARPTDAPALPLAGAADSALLAAGTPVEVAGWGLADIQKVRSPALARAGKLTVQPSSRCRTDDSDLHRHFSAALQLCALDRSAFEATGCFGDSGGPAIARRPDGTPVEIGIVSAGGFACEPQVPNLFTRVDRVSRWAYEWVAAVEAGAPEPAIPALPAPTMHLVEAKIFARRGLGEDFARGARTRLEGSIAIGCSRASRSRFRCRVRWRDGDALYYGAIFVLFTPYRRVPTWNDGYAIHRVSESCLRTRSPRRCPVHTRTARPGSPKHV